MITKCKRIGTALLAVLMLFAALVPLSASAAEITMDLSKAEVSWDYTLTDYDGNTFSAAYGIRAEDNLSGNAIAPKLRNMHDYTAKRPGLGSDKSKWVYGQDYVYCFCIEHGIPLPNSGSYSGSSDPHHGNKYEMLSESQKDLLSLALAYGYTNRTDLKTSQDANACYAATQLIVWQISLGFRSSPTQLADKSYPASGYTGTMTEQYCRNKYFKQWYDLILSDMASHSVRPSFTSNVPASAKTYEMEYANGRYSVTLTDANHVLNKYYVSVSGGVSVSVSGNTLTISSNTPVNDAVTIKLNRRMPSTNSTTGFLIWSVPGKEAANQDMVSGVPADNDPVPSYLKVKTAYGSAKIVKTSEDGKVDGINFHVQGNSIDKTVQTKNGGQIQIDNLMPGVYTVTELTEDRYEPQEVRRVTIVSGQTATVTFSNVLKRGDLTVTKTSEDGLSEGAKFHLFGTSLSGLAVDEYAVVGSDGKAYFRDVLIGSGYVLEEVDTAIRYVVPDKQTAAIEWKKVTEKSFDNILKKWQLTVTKSDSETGTAQGDASLAGAEYGIFKGEQLIDTYTTDANGQFTTKYYICDSDWSLREISASEGYLVNTESLHIGAEPKLYTVEYNSTVLDTLETVQKGKIAVIKHCDDGETQIETPEAGAEFEVFLKASGGYENAKESERDYLVCDENGFAETKLLPYGIYTVRQTKGWEGNELMDAFDVFVSKDGETYRYLLINNAEFKAYVKVIKTDAETGKSIPYAGAGFQIYDPSGNKVEMTFTYPEITTIDTFYTTEDGTLITPEVLDYGTGYSLVEVSAPYGYVLNSDPVYFDITEDASTEEGAVTIVKVERPNMPQKGTITVSKSGEVFSSVTEADGLYQPVYALAGLAGAVYEITAAEDIITPDGTLRYSKGEVAATIETDSTGTATTEPLYLGSYEIREVKAPYGMVLNPETKSAQLTYAGQEIEITETAASFYNERQHIRIDLSKIMEQDKQFQIGMNGEILSVQFGLFAAENLTAADGSVIPADGLMEIVSCDENGKAAFASDIPVGAKLYVKEIATNEQYILSDEKYPVNFEYAGQDVATVSITVSNGETIPNDIIYGTIKGLKIDRETEDSIAGAIFGLFRSDEAEYTEETAILTAESGEDGVFTFENVPYGNWLIKELKPAEGFLPNEELYPVTVTAEEEIIEITVVNDRIPEIGTTAAVDGEKEICATEIFTLTDTVSYKHLISGKEYVLKGVLMDKSTGKPLVIDGEEIHAETAFTPDAPNGEVTVEFTFDSKFIKADTDIVVFESLYKDGKELAVHADIEDEGQTVKVKAPEIGTKASVDGKKEITAKGTITVEDIVSYKNLTPGKEYTITGILMDKAAGKPFTVNGEQIRSSYTFKPETADGEVKMTFTFDASGITKTTEIVVFESVSRDGAEIAVHADIEDGGQTVKLIPPTPDVPQTGDNSNLGFWIGLGAVALGGLVSVGIMAIKRKKDDDDE